MRRVNFHYLTLPIHSLLGSLLLICFMVFPNAQALADQVPISLAVHSGYGRIVFNWPKPVYFTANLTGRKLVVQFGRPIQASFANVTRGLSKYIGAAKAGSDGHSVTFTLKDGFTMRSFDMGKAIVIDIMDGESTTQASSKKTASLAPSKKAKPNASASTVRIRTGVHQKYTRIVFDWAKKPPYTISRQGDKAHISFERPAVIDVSRLNNRPPKNVLGASSEKKDNGITVTLTIPESSRLRHFLSGSKVVVDVMPPGSRKVPPVAEAPQEKPVEHKTEANVKKTVGAPKHLTPPESPPKTTQAPAEEGAASTKAMKAVEAGGAVSMRFDWNEPVAAAVFRRAGNLWVVFDKPVKMDTDKLLKQGGGIFHGIEQIPSKRATILRMNTIVGVNPELKRDGMAWLFKFRKKPLKATTAIEVKAQPNSPVGARLFITVSDPGTAVVIRDPEVGDKIVAVPVITLGYGVAHIYEYPQAHILKSSQGVVIVPKSDGIKVRPLRQGIEVTNLEGMQLSPVTAVATAGLKLLTMRPLTRAFSLKGWHGEDIKVRAEKKRHMEKIAAMARGFSRKKARLDMVKFLLSNGYAAEALGVLRVLEKDSPELLTNIEFKAFRGISNFLMGRLKDARKDFEDASLQGNDEGAFWLAAVQAAEGDFLGAAKELRRTGAVIQSYPSPMQLPLSLLAVEAAIAVEDAKKAEDILGTIDAENVSSGHKGQLDYLSGRLLELGGDFDGAVSKWESAQEGTNPLSRALSSVARTERLLKLEEITNAQAIEEFEKLRFAWRGDNFEFNLLRRLGQLYMANGNYRNGLRTLKQTVTHFGKHEKTPEVAQEMHDAFAKLYIEGEADQLPPITAIALYDEFKELSPVGAKGDKMVQKLAERLIDVDLLDRGAALLDGQIKYRLKGEEKAQVGARLAQVHLLARLYKKSIQALADTDAPNLNPILKEQRRHLEARAMMGLKQDLKALDILKDDKSIDADLLRTNIFWKTENWSKAAQTLRRLVRSFEAKPNKPLDDKQSKYVLNLAVALALSGNERSLNRVRSDYWVEMEKSPLKEAFNLITSPENLGLIDYRTIASKVGVAESFQTFMTSYQERLKEKKL